MKIGYARVSKAEQNIEMQIDALKEAGCDKIITEEMSGTISERPGLTKLKDILRAGDTLVVWKLDRLGRSLKHLIHLIQEFSESGIGFCSLQESINTGTATGQLIFHVFAALAEFERSLIRERTLSGIAAARARGRKGGRPKKIDEKGRQIAIKLYNSKQYSIREIEKMIGITKPTLYKYIKEFNTVAKN